MAQSWQEYSYNDDCNDLEAINVYYRVTNAQTWNPEHYQSVESFKIAFPEINRESPSFQKGIFYDLMKKSIPLGLRRVPNNVCPEILNPKVDEAVSQMRTIANHLISIRLVVSKYNKKKKLYLGVLARLLKLNINPGGRPKPFALRCIVLFESIILGKPFLSCVEKHVLRIEWSQIFCDLDVQNVMEQLEPEPMFEVTSGTARWPFFNDSDVRDSEEPEALIFIPQSRAFYQYNLAQQLFRISRNDRPKMVHIFVALRNKLKDKSLFTKDELTDFLSLHLAKLKQLLAAKNKVGLRVVSFNNDRMKQDDLIIIDSDPFFSELYDDTCLYWKEVDDATDDEPLADQVRDQGVSLNQMRNHLLEILCLAVILFGVVAFYFRD